MQLAGLFAVRHKKNEIITSRESFIQRMPSEAGKCLDDAFTMAYKNKAAIANAKEMGLCVTIYALFNSDGRIITSLFFTDGGPSATLDTETDTLKIVDQGIVVAELHPSILYHYDFAPVIPEDETKMTSDPVNPATPQGPTGEDEVTEENEKSVESVGNEDLLRQMSGDSDD